eukprot:11207590-Lingulodinium_polyedra.AAC.1
MPHAHQHAVFAQKRIKRRVQYKPWCKAPNPWETGMGVYMPSRSEPTVAMNERPIAHNSTGQGAKTATAKAVTLAVSTLKAKTKIDAL